MILPKLVITDIDGVWTDGGMYYDGHGNELKKFNTSDSAGVLFLKSLGIPLAIFTGEDTAIVAQRAKKLGVNLLFQGVKDKLSLALELCQELNIQISEIAFIGDDINDIRLLNAVGLSACPANAPIYIKKKVDIVIERSGGTGAFREFIERILSEHSLLDQTILDCISNMSKPI